MIRVKICGITRPEDGLAAQEAGADAIGFVFAKSARKISVEKARAIIAVVGPWISTVGVFVNEKPSAVLKVAATCKLSAVQLHGDETPAQLKLYKKAGFKVIKAFRVDGAFEFARMEGYPADAYLLDTFASGQYGGTGRSFDWSLLKKRKFSKPWIVSGGLRPDTVAELLKICQPYGVDVSGGVEKSPGIKDEFLMRKFIQNVKTR